ncbi:MAG: hypothetical protein QOH28_3217 [Actinomycetota bacterium]|nr:hypothetical protein [Actinomycetota bacterium]
MKLGIVTPVLKLLQRAHSQWEQTECYSDIYAILKEA